MPGCRQSVWHGGFSVAGSQIEETAFPREEVHHDVSTSSQGRRNRRIVKQEAYWQVEFEARITRDRAIRVS